MIDLQIFHTIWKFLFRENLHRLFIFVMVVWILSAISITWLEGFSLADGIWWSIVTLTTVGYGDITPDTFGGRVVAFALMLIGVGIFGTFSATIASVLIDQKIKEYQGRSKYKLKSHTILCQWNDQTQFIIDELRSDPKTASSLIVLIADIEQKPLDDDNLYFIKGEVNEDTLARANIAQANTVVVLGDQTLEITARDGKVVLTTLMIESINPDAYTIVELADKRNTRHAERAKADEIIVTSELNSGLIARATLDHGMTQVISTLLKNDEGDELYKVPVPTSMGTQLFIDVLLQMKRDYQSTVIALQKADTKKIISNPDFDLQVNPHDYLFVIAADRPQIR